MLPSESNSNQTLRIIDVSLNRAAEGLRFLEDTARFILNDTALTEQLKTIRHSLVTSGWPFQNKLIQARDSEGDIGANLKVEEGIGKTKDLPLAIVANSRRVQEALRTLEELAKVNGDDLPRSADKFQQARSIAHPTPLALYFALLTYPLSQGKAEDFVVRLKMPGLTARAIRDTLHLKSKLPSLAGPGLSPSAVSRLLQEYSPTSILACTIASDSALVQQRLHLYLNNWHHVKTSLDGVALQQMGIPQGPQLGQMLRLLHEAKLDGRVNTREQEIEMVQLWLAQEI